MKGALFCAALLAICGCMSTLQIKKGSDGGNGKSEGVPGIPFYVKKAYNKHETVWLETQYRVTLSCVEVDSATSKVTATKDVRSKLVGGSSANENCLYKLKGFVEGNDNTLQASKIESLFDSLPPYKTPHGAPDTSYLILVTNTCTPSVYIDYDTPYYINAKRPWIGTATVNAEIQSDGTLGKGDAEVADNTAETLLAALPIKEFLTSKLIPSTEEATTGAQEFMMNNNREKTAKKAVTQERYVLTIEPIQYLHVLSEPWIKANTLSEEPIDITYKNKGTVQYQRTKVGTQEKKEKKDDESTIGISGEVKLPAKKGDEDKK